MVAKANGLILNQTQKDDSEMNICVDIQFFDLLPLSYESSESLRIFEYNRLNRAILVWLFLLPGSEEVPLIH